MFLIYYISVQENKLNIPSMVMGQLVTKLNKYETFKYYSNELINFRKFVWRVLNAIELTPDE